jgi:glycosyltransferase involved in cell wall biosynthesis
MLAGVDPRLRVVRGRGEGVATARNRGIEESGGDWIAFKDDDDWWAPDKLEAQVRAAEAAGARWCLAGAVTVTPGLAVVDELEPPEPRTLATQLLSRYVIPGGGSNALVAADLVRAVGGFDPELDFEDWDYWLRLALREPPAVVDRALVAYTAQPVRRSAQVAGRQAFAQIESRYVEERRQAGAGDDWPRWLGWVAEMQQRAGSRGAAAWTQLEIAGRTHDPKRLLRAAVVAAWPGSIRINDWVRRRRIDDRYLRDGEAWLEPLRATAPG